MNDKYKIMFRDLHWMAYRYVHGRKSAAVSIFNEITYYLLKQGIEPIPTDGRIFARDGMEDKVRKLFCLPAQLEEAEKEYMEKYNEQS